MDAGQVGGLNINFEYANEEASKILEEAANVVESRMKEKFPDLPSMSEDTKLMG
jgi:division protein CdvB (Snf7/Vps24/ESCRT-III family)